MNEIWRAKFRPGAPVVIATGGPFGPCRLSGHVAEVFCQQPQVRYWVTIYDGGQRMLLFEHELEARPDYKSPDTDDDVRRAIWGEELDRRIPKMQQRIGGA